MSYVETPGADKFRELKNRRSNDDDYLKFTKGLSPHLGIFADAPDKINQKPRPEQ